MAEREAPLSILGRMEGLLNQTRTASPSGSETLHDKLTLEIAALRASLSSPVKTAPTAPTPTPAPVPPVITGP